MKNYYKILGVEQNSTLDEIKKNYLAKMKKFHPDIYKGNPDYAQNQTALLNEAYQTLKDDALRNNYDYKLNTYEKNLSEQTKTWSTNKKPVNHNLANSKTIKQKKMHNHIKINTKSSLNKDKKQRTIIDLAIIILAIMLITIFMLSVVL